MHAISSLFHWAIFFAIVFAIFAGFSYNKLQRLAQSVHKAKSNISVALRKKIDEINQLGNMVKGYQEYEQFTMLKLATDANAVTMAAAYQQSQAALMAIQGAAQRFPELHASPQYLSLQESIRECEGNIQHFRVIYNESVGSYNSVCLSIPTVFISKMMGFPQAPYLDFDTSGLSNDTGIKEFKTDDGERLKQLLGQGGGAVIDAGKSLMAHAGQMSKTVSDRLAAETGKEMAAPKLPAGPQYFYLITGSVPQGPAPIEDIRGMVLHGKLPLDVLVAEAGTTEWVPISQTVAG